MGFILTLLIISALVAIFIWRMEDAECGIIAFVVCFAISSVIMAFVWGSSYYTYVDLFERKAAHENCIQTIAKYVDKATPSFGKLPNVSVSGRELTDFKFQNYQTSLAELLKDARYNAMKYNASLAGKKVMAKSWYFGACIITDDSLEPIQLE